MKSTRKISDIEKHRANESQRIEHENNFRDLLQDVSEIADLNNDLNSSDFGHGGSDYWWENV